MENIKALVRIISDIKNLSSCIIIAALPLMKDVETIESDHVKTLVTEIPDLQTDHALNTLQEIMLGWVEDAEKLKDEVEKFVSLEEDALSSRLDIKLKMEECPLLSEVWNGDAYDKHGIEGLKELRAELKRKSENITEENLLKEARTVLLGEDLDV